MRYARRPVDSRYAAPPTRSDRERLESSGAAGRNERHERGHPLPDNQAEHAEEYLRCRICSYFLKDHPQLQEYVIVGQK